VIFLPIVGRELRVASRKRSTFWIRIVAAIVALMIATGFLILSAVGSFALATTTLGEILFGVLTWLSLGAALSAGLFFTSDCLSEEKREGTLGFLFLTDLRGYDVVLGKLMATSLRSFFAIFAVLPILAITLLMGGVTGAEFWKTSLALVNALFLSLAAGLFVSAISRDPQKAMAGTLVLLVLLAGAGPAMDAALSPGAFQPVLSTTSPVYVFVSSTGFGRTLFWKALLINQLLAWTLLVLSCVLLPRTWQEKATKISRRRGRYERWWKFSGVRRRARLRAKWIGVNPFLWLACRERWQAAVLWIVTILMAGVLVAMFTASQPMVWLGWGYAAGALSLLLYLGIASQAGRLFVEAQRSGLIELLLVTPLTVKEIVQGQWRALLKMFGVPLAVCLVAQMVGTVLAQQMTFKQFAAAAAAVPAVAPTTNSGTIAITNTTVVTSTTWTGRTTAVIGGMFRMEKWMPIVTAITAALTMFANLLALCWFGMWMGLNSKNTNVATLKTMVFVQIIPWFGVTFAAGLMVPLLLMPMMMKGGVGASPQFFMWFPLLSAVLTTVLYLIKDVVFVVWSRRKLHSEFRARAMRTVLPIRLQPPPVLSSPPVASLPVTGAQ